MRALVNLGEGEKSLPTRRWAYSSIAWSTRQAVKRWSTRQAVKRWWTGLSLPDFFVSDRGEDGTAVVSVAHEALFGEVAAAHRVVERESRVPAIARARFRGSEPLARREARQDFLLPPGKPLADAEALMAAYRGDLEADLIDYIELSSKRERERRRCGPGRRRLWWSSSPWSQVSLPINGEMPTVSETLFRPSFSHGQSSSRELACLREGKLADTLATWRSRCGSADSRRLPL